MGNLRTPDAEILDELIFFRPGRLLPGEAEILRAEIRLLMAFHKRFDLADRQRPRIEVGADPDSTYVDIRVRFPEKSKKQ